MSQQARLHRINQAVKAEQHERPHEWEANYSLDRQIAEARADMTPARWQELNEEFDRG